MIIDPNNKRRSYTCGENSKKDKAIGPDETSSEIIKLIGGIRTNKYTERPL